MRSMRDFVKNENEKGKRKKKHRSEEGKAG